MEHAAVIRTTAEMSVGRACMFAALGIWAACFGFITWPVAALRLAAILTTLALVVLIYKAVQAPRRPFRRTEVWILVRKSVDLPDAVAQQLISQALQETFWRPLRWDHGTDPMAVRWRVLASRRQGRILMGRDIGQG
ncbi:MAG: hypothetical protein FJX52_02565 [Alphaproteobacteria bacterium]|nr:hypothetical protein [Alphaproteobacteria bacterium]